MTSNSEDLKLPNPITVWYRMNNEDNKKNINQEEYTEMIKSVTEMSTLSEFQKIYSFLKKPENSSVGLEISLFKNGIKPVWEEEANYNGGKVNIKLKKEMSNNIWDELVVRFAGNTLPEINNDDVNGILFSVKYNFIAIQIWTKSYNNQLVLNLNMSLRSIFNLDEFFEFEIRPFNKAYNNQHAKRGNYQK